MHKIYLILIVFALSMSYGCSQKRTPPPASAGLSESEKNEAVKDAVTQIDVAMAEWVHYQTQSIWAIEVIADGKIIQIEQAATLPEIIEIQKRNFGVVRSKVTDNKNIVSSLSRWTELQFDAANRLKAALKEESLKTGKVESEKLLEIQERDLNRLLSLQRGLAAEAK